MTDQNCAYCMEGDLVAAFGIKICELPSSKVYLFFTLPMTNSEQPVPFTISKNVTRITSSFLTSFPPFYVFLYFTI